MNIDAVIVGKYEIFFFFFFKYEAGGPFGLDLSYGEILIVISGPTLLHKIRFFSCFKIVKAENAFTAVNKRPMITSAFMSISFKTFFFLVCNVSVLWQF